MPHLNLLDIDTAGTAFLVKTSFGLYAPGPGTFSLSGSLYFAYIEHLTLEDFTKSYLGV